MSYVFRVVTYNSTFYSCLLTYQKGSWAEQFQYKRINRGLYTNVVLERLWYNPFVSSSPI